MTDGARREYAAALRERYQAADKRGKGQILDEYCRTTGCHRKSAIRRLATPARPAGRRPGRPPRYGPELLPLLDRVWQASDHLCGKLLVPMVAPLLQALEQHHGLPIAGPVRAALVAASPATLDRLLRPLRRRRGPRNVIADRDPTMLTEKTRTVPIDKRISDVKREGLEIWSLAKGGISRRADMADGRHN